ncbi:uncharacterized protein LOC122364883 [Amphibalanus amphitrite]|uniref:uncharacterized protein LOC122364883 n=1 Tax=Amphibalanus amphitrite TaxID=1232801 RepID=UPI001C8FF4B7|nr:uncharacterized protein LOC122364883 [Amphibalanus amphitrite]XP_043191624.1 uncharacterized protein LOC122364883 [Amphibalanus amphitrite]
MGLPPKEKVQFACTVIALPLYALTLFFNYASSNASLGIVPKSAADVSDTHEVFITPIGWAFAIWGIIYTWLGIGLVYGLSQLWRRTDAGPVYLTPVTLPLSFWLLIIASFCVNVGWLFAWGYEELTAACVLLLLLALCNVLALVVLHIRYYRAQFAQPPPTPRENWYVKTCVHNGLALYTTWTIIAALINLDVVIVYVGEGSNEVASSAIAGVLAASIVIWLLLEITVLDKYTRWTITPGFVLVWALSAVYQKNYDIATGSTPTMLMMALVTACVSLAGRLATLVYFTYRDSSSRSMRVTCA